MYFPTFDRLANCDASELLPNAETVGDCSASLPSGGSCTNVVSSVTDCTPTTCFDGVLSPGLCSIFTLISSGTCQSNNRDEVPQVDCETAAISLGLGDTSVYVGTDPAYYAVRPEGCIYDGSSNLRFNTLTTSLGCGADGHDCICKFDHSNGGSVSPPC